MSKEERDRKRKNKKRLRLILIFFILAYLIFRTVPTFYATTFKTTLAEEGELEDVVKAEGVVIKKEDVYKSEGNGKISTYYKEGDRAGAGKKIASISLTDDKSALEEELKEINVKIENLKKADKEGKSLKTDKKEVKENLSETIELLQDKISKEDFEDVSLVKENIYLNMGKNTDVSGENTLLKQSLDNLNKRKAELIKEISDNTINYFSKECGIVSFDSDGLEDIYSAENLDNYTLDKFERVNLKEKKIKNNDKVETGDFIFKIIYNFEWYIGCIVDDSKKIESLETGNTVEITANDGKDRIKGKVEKIEKKDGKALLILKFNSFFQDFYNKRYIDINIVKAKYEGIKVPLKSICDVDGLKGIYIKDISGIIRFRPVIVLGHNDKYAIIQEGDGNNYIKLKDGDETRKTVGLFDEIIINGDSVKEGQIVD